MEDITLPADLLSHGFKVIERDEQRLVHLAKPLRFSSTSTIQRRRYILVSECWGVATGLTMDEAITAARKIRDFIKWCKRKEQERRDELRRIDH